MCSTALRASANGLKSAIHYVGIHIAESRVLECAGKPADNLEAKASPEPHGALVRADYKIELHRAESTLAGALQRVRAHGPRDAAARAARRCHVTAIRDVRSAALLVGLQEIRANDFTILFRDENLMIG